MPFGLANAPHAFMSMMQRLLGHLPFVAILLDDVCIFSTDPADHASHVDTVSDTGPVLVVA